MLGRPQWTSRPIAAFDAETTGADPFTDRCVEVALVVVAADGTRLAGGHHAVIDPGVAVPQEAEDVHGITAARIRAEGVRPAAGLGPTIRALGACAAARLPLVIFNARFDWPLLLTEAARWGLCVPRLPLVDPLVLDRAADPDREGKRTLDALADHYGVDRGAAHTATDDALCAARVAQALAARHPTIVARDADALHLRQARWFVEWRDRCNVERHCNGNDGRVSGRWPL